MLINRHHRTSKQANKRRGAAVVEFAVCVPVLVLIVFGSIEMTNGIYLKQAGTAAAYEAARVVTATGGLESSATTRAQEVLAGYSVVGATIAISPAVDSTTPRGTYVSVSVTIPSRENSHGLNMLLGSSVIDAEVTMVKQ